MKTLKDFNFQNKKAIIRVDFNVPLNNQFEVTDATRIEAAKSTIIKVLEDGGSCVLMSHLGRPKGKQEEFSLKHIVAKVKEIGLRTSMVESRDGVAMIIPNHILVSEKLTNWSASDAVNRFSIQIGVAYGSDVELVKKILTECAWRHSKVITNPAPIVLFRDFGDSSLDFELVFWSNFPFVIEIIKSDLRFSIEADFRKNKVVIPFPQRDLHIMDPAQKSLIQQKLTE